MKVLLVSFFNPLEPNSGSGLRSNCLLKSLTELGYKVHLFAFSQTDTSGQLTNYPNVVKSCLVKKIPRSALQALLRSIYFLQPLAISHYITKNIIQAFVQFTSRETYDAVIFDYIYTFALKKHLKDSGGKAIIYEHNAEYIMAQESYKQREKLRLKFIWLIDYFLLRRYEFNALRSVDCVVHVSDHDRDKFSTDIKGKSVVIPNTLPYKKKYEAKTDQENNVVFVGSMFHYANVEGITRFIREAWVDIHSRRRDINLLIVGGNPPPEIQEYNGKYNIQVLGYVDDLSPIYEKASIAIAPIYIGSGARLKIVEAMMYSTLNITSPKGAEGLLVEDGRHIVIAIDRQAWISKILFYLDNKRERVVIEKNAYDLVEKEYYYAKYKQVIERCIGNRIDHLRYSE